jgi:hypothetical protein
MQNKTYAFNLFDGEFQLGYTRPKILFTARCKFRIISFMNFYIP